MKILKVLGRMLIWVVAIAALIFLVQRVRAAFEAKRTQALEESQNVVEKAVPVRVARVELGNARQEVTLAANIEAANEINVAPTVSGRLKELQLEDGTPIEVGLRLSAKGTQIAVIDHDAFTAQVAQAEGALAAAKAQIAQAKAGTSQAEAGVEAAKSQRESAKAAVMQAEAGVATAQARLAADRVNLANLEKNKERLTNLLEEGAVTKKQLDDIETRYEAAKAGCTAAESEVREAKVTMLTMKAQQAAAGSEIRRAEAAIQASAATQESAAAGVAQAEATLRLAQIQLHEAFIRAPAPGMVASKHVDAGEMVGPRVPVVTIVVIDPVKALVDVSERHLSKIAVGVTKASISLDAFPETGFEGTVSRTRPSLNRETRTVQVEIDIPNPEHRLWPGMFGRATLLLDEHKEVPMVPRDVIMRTGDLSYVFLVNSRKAVKRPVRLGFLTGSAAEILEGLDPGDTIVVSGQTRLYDGATVELVSE